MFKALHGGRIVAVGEDLTAVLEYAKALLQGSRDTACLLDEVSGSTTEIDAATSLGEALLDLRLRRRDAPD